MFDRGNCRNVLLVGIDHNSALLAHQIQAHTQLHYRIRGFIAAYDANTGKEVWTRDFSSYGSGGDEAGVCLMNGRLYYSCFFGHSARLPSGAAGPQGITAALEPETGKTLWLTSRVSSAFRRNIPPVPGPAWPLRYRSLCQP